MACACCDREVKLDEIDDYLLLPDEAYVDANSRRRWHSYDANDDSFRFSPPLYRQRYSTVIQELKKYPECIDKVVDFGCAEGAFLCRAIRSLARTTQTFVGVDMDENVLKAAETALKMESFENIFDDPPPCVTYLYRGSVANYDDRLDNTDAVVAIELIEHLQPDVLSDGVDMIFSRIAPYLVILTTPNVEFNVLFDMGDRQFRHDDHKFEWERKEFEKWCRNIICKYPRYDVEFKGIGAGPDGTKDSIGHASQMAIFRWKGASAYLRLKEKRLKLIRAAQETNRRWVIEHMAGEGDTKDGVEACQNEHPYQLVAKYVLLTDQPTTLQCRRAIFYCKEYCREIFHQRSNLPTNETADSGIVTDEETRIRGIWLELEELIEIPTARKICKTVTDLGCILMTDECFIPDGSGFNAQFRRVFYQNEEDLAYWKFQCQQNNSSGDEDEYQQ